MALIKEDGTGKVDANSYASVAEGDTFFEGHGYTDLWTAATPERKATMLVMATTVIDAKMQFYGYKATSAQALQWPRENCPDPDGMPVANLPAYFASDQVPKGIVNATCVMAQELMKVDRTDAPPGEGILTEWTSYDGKKYDKEDKRHMLPELVESMLAKFGVLVEPSSVAVRLVRV